MADLLQKPETMLGHTPLGYLISKSSSEKYGIQYISITPRMALYSLPIRLAGYTLIAASLSFAAAVVISLSFARRNERNVRNIINLLNDAGKAASSAEAPRKDKTDPYHYIIQRIVKHFLENKYLNVQLAERKVTAELMELSALQAQLNPHFLLNTLEAIQWKAVSLIGNTNNEVSKMIEHLGDILKTALNYDHKFISLKEEFKHAETYIAIQNFRYKEKFDTLWSYSPKTLRVQVIKLLLQPIVENSIYHGIRNLKGRKALIKIKARENDGILYISVSDNGVGIEASKLHELRRQLLAPIEQSSHIGVFNTNKRLLLAYGTEFRLQLYSKAGWGTMVKISIPVVMQPKEQDVGV